MTFEAPSPPLTAGNETLSIIEEEGNRGEGEFAILKNPGFDSSRTKKINHERKERIQKRWNKEECRTKKTKAIVSSLSHVRKERVTSQNIVSHKNTVKINSNAKTVFIRVFYL